MDSLETEVVEMVEQNGKQEGDVLIEDILKSNSTSSNLSGKSNRQTKVKDFAEISGKNKVSVEEIPVEDPKKTAELAEQFKNEGNAHYKTGEYRKSIDLYSKAIGMRTSWHIFKI